HAGGVDVDVGARRGQIAHCRDAVAGERDVGDDRSAAAAVVDGAVAQDHRVAARRAGARAGEAAGEGDDRAAAHHTTPARASTTTAWAHSMALAAASSVPTPRPPAASPAT